MQTPATRDTHGFNVPTENRWVPLPEAVLMLKGNARLNEQKIADAVAQLPENLRGEVFKPSVNVLGTGSMSPAEVKQNFLAELVIDGKLTTKDAVDVPQGGAVAKLFERAGMVDSVRGR